MTDLDTSDEQLLWRFVAGESAALGELARRHEAMLLGLCVGLLGGRSDLAMDAVQETWVRVIRSAGLFAGRSSFRTWVYRIAVNQCRTMLDRVRRGDARAGGRLGEGAAAPEAAGASGGGELAGAVRRAVAGMAAARAEVLLLCYHAGLTHEQAAEVLEIPVGTLKSRLHAALGELRRTLPSEVAR